MITRPLAYTIFSQQVALEVDAASWHRNAQSFFDASVELVVATPDARVACWRHGEPRSLRSVFVRARVKGDLEAAEAAERAGGGAGLSLLARRCPVVVLVATEAEPDASALLLAAIIASAALGPILAPSQQQIYGMKTARLLAESMLAAGGTPEPPAPPEHQ